MYKKKIKIYANQTLAKSLFCSIIIMFVLFDIVGYSVIIQIGINIKRNKDCFLIQQRLRDNISREKRKSEESA